MSSLGLLTQVISLVHFWCFFSGSGHYWAIWTNSLSGRESIPFRFCKSSECFCVLFAGPAPGVAGNVGRIGLCLLPGGLCQQRAGALGCYRGFLGRFCNIWDRFPAQLLGTRTVCYWLALMSAPRVTLSLFMSFFLLYYLGANR